MKKVLVLLLVNVSIWANPVDFERWVRQLNGRIITVDLIGDMHFGFQQFTQAGLKKGILSPQERFLYDPSIRALLKALRKLDQKKEVTALLFEGRIPEEERIINVERGALGYIIDRFSKEFSGAVQKERGLDAVHVDSWRWIGGLGTTFVKNISAWENMTAADLSEEKRNELVSALRSMRETVNKAYDIFLGATQKQDSDFVQQIIKKLSEYKKRNIKIIDEVIEKIDKKDASATLYKLLFDPILEVPNLEVLMTLFTLMIDKPINHFVIYFGDKHLGLMESNLLNLGFKNSISIQLNSYKDATGFSFFLSDKVWDFLKEDPMAHFNKPVQANYLTRALLVEGIKRFVAIMDAEKEREALEQLKNKSYPKAYHFTNAINSPVERDEQWITALEHALKMGWYDAVKHLLDLGANPNTIVTDEQGRKQLALIWALSNNLDLAELLLQHGANPENAFITTDALQASLAVAVSPEIRTKLEEQLREAQKEEEKKWQDEPYKLYPLEYAQKLLTETEDPARKEKLQTIIDRLKPKIKRLDRLRRGAPSGVAYFQALLKEETEEPKRAELAATIEEIKERKTARRKPRSAKRSQKEQILIKEGKQEI